MIDENEMTANSMRMTDEDEERVYQFPRIGRHDEVKPSRSPRFSRDSDAIQTQVESVYWTRGQLSFLEFVIESRK